ncbi:MAG: hypothetical protein ACK59B_00940, partial [Alphaproteobacteria bacterium]
MQQVFAHNRNEISAFAAELVFCEVPGEFLQWGWDGEGVGVGIGGGVALIDAVGGGVAGVSPPPVCLCFLAADGLALGLAAGALAVADSWVRIEPPQAIPAGALPQSGHPLLSARLSGGQLFVGRGGQVFASAEELPPPRPTANQKYGSPALARPPTSLSLPSHAISGQKPFLFTAENPRKAHGSTREFR